MRLIADASSYGVPAAALTISIIGLLVTTFMNARTQSRSASKDRIEELEDEIEELDKKLEACQRELSILRAREIELMRQLVRAQ
jgi:uncharacterized membrane-anchored protein YhcB (DUF1043 family)